MRRIFHLTLLCIAGGAVSACTPDLVVQTENIPTAGVRFINAVPDSSGAFGLDLRFVDILESNAHFRMTFRNGPSAAAPFVSTLTQYKGARAGSRNFRIFLDDTLQTIAKTVVKDTTVTLVANTNYTALLQGNGRSTGADAMRLTWMTDAVTDPAAQVAVRAINATNAAVDVRVYVQGSTVPAAVTWTIPAYSASPFQNFAPAILMYNVRAAGGVTSLFTDAQAIVGVGATCSNRTCVGTEPPDVEAQPGTTIAGSAITGVVFPRSTAGARTPQTAAFGAPVITFMWDRRPPRGCDPKYC